MWFMTMPRRTVMRGIVKIGVPAFSRDHDCINCSSLAPASAARPAATLLSKNSRFCCREAATAGRSVRPSAGAISNEFLLTMSAAQPDSSARCPARRPSGIDLSCGFQRSLSSGILSRVLRVLAISRSNSGNKKSLIAILIRSLCDCVRPVHYRRAESKPAASVRLTRVQNFRNRQVPDHHVFLHLVDYDLVRLRRLGYQKLHRLVNRAIFLFHPLVVGQHLKGELVPLWVCLLQLQLDVADLLRLLGFGKLELDVIAFTQLPERREFLAIGRDETSLRAEFAVDALQIGDGLLQVGLGLCDVCFHVTHFSVHFAELAVGLGRLVLHLGELRRHLLLLL